MVPTFRPRAALQARHVAATDRQLPHLPHLPAVYPLPASLHTSVTPPRPVCAHGQLLKHVVRNTSFAPAVPGDAKLASMSEDAFDSFLDSWVVDAESAKFVGK